MFSGELKAFLRGPGVRNTTHWSLVFLATATVVTSAVALYYYASTHGYDATGIGLRYYLSLLTPQELGLVSTFSSGLFEHGEYDDDDCDDDEPVDPDLLDGYGSSQSKSRHNVILVSSDPSSDLCHRPLQLDLIDGKTRRGFSSEHTLAKPCTSILKPSPCGYSQRNIKKGHNRSCSYSYASKDDHLGRSLSILVPEKRLKTSSSYDSIRAYGKGSPQEDQSNRRTRRKVLLTEPDWEPFASIHDRARQRTILAVLARSYTYMSSEGSVPSTPLEEKALEFFSQTQPMTSFDEDDGKKFWFERFTQSSAAAGKRRDLRGRSNHAVSNFDSEAFGQLLLQQQ